MTVRHGILGLVVFALMGPFAANLEAQQLKRDLQDTKVASFWHYNDWESAKAAAEKANKPIFALFR